MSNSHILDDFDTLHSAIQKVFDEAIKQLRKKARSVTFVSGMHFFLVSLGIAGFGTYTTSTLLPFISILVWVLAMIMPAALIAGWLHGKKVAVFLGFSFVFNPVLLGISIHLLTPWLSLPADPNPALVYGGVAVLLSVVSFAFLYGSMFVISDSFSSTLLLMLSSTSLRDVLSAVPSHAELVKRATSAGIQSIAQWDEARVQHVADVAKIRLDGSNAQGQAFSFILATIGLMSALGLVLTQDQIRSAFSAVESFLSQAIYGEPLAPSASGGVAIVTAIILGCIIAIGLFFFSTSYQALRTLEVMQIVCLVRIAELTTASTPSVRQPLSRTSLSREAESQIPRLLGGLLVLMSVWRFLFPRRKH